MNNSAVDIRESSPEDYIGVVVEKTFSGYGLCRGTITGWKPELELFSVRKMHEWCSQLVISVSCRWSLMMVTRKIIARQISEQCSLSLNRSVMTPLKCIVPTQCMHTGACAASDQGGSKSSSRTIILKRPRQRQRQRPWSWSWSR